MLPHRLISSVMLALLAIAGPWARAADPESTEAAQRRLLEANNTTLRKALDEKTREVAELRAELQRLKALLDKAGIKADLPAAGAAANKAGVVGNQVLPQQPVDGNTFFAEAALRSSKLDDEFRARTNSPTTAQKSQQAIAVRKQFEESLPKGPVRFSCTVRDVVAMNEGKVIRVFVSEERPGGEQPVGSWEIRITGTAEDAAKITKNSKVVLTGVLDRSPDHTISRQQERQFLGTASGFPIVFQEDPVVEIDGVKRELTGSSSFRRSAGRRQ